MKTAHLPVDSSAGRPWSTREWLGLAAAAMLAIVAFAISSAGGNVPSVRAAEPIPVTIAFTAGNKPYDGNTDAAIVTCDVVGAVEGDDVTCDSTSATATFDDKTAVDGKTVDGSGFVLAGADKDNYNLTNGDSASTTANIAPLEVTIAFTAGNKPYDGNTDAAIVTCDVVGAVEGDDVTCDSTSATATFDDKTAVDGKTVDGSGFVLPAPTRTTTT